jgi:DNA-binding response OmpR family regulator
MAKKILVLDDDPNIRKAVKVLLESEGFKVKIGRSA